MQDITPSGKKPQHLNSIFQPSTAIDAPGTGIVTTSLISVTRRTTGVNYFSDCEAASFAVETPKRDGCGLAEFDDRGDYELGSVRKAW